MRPPFHATLALLLAPLLFAVAGCGNGVGATSNSNAAFAIVPAVGSGTGSSAIAIDTNCTGCNATNAQGGSVYQFATTLAGTNAEAIRWSVSGGDAVSGPGSINAAGQYTPPSFLTADRVSVVITATLERESNAKATTALTITPGFLQPLTPENVALGAGESVTLTGVLSEAGGTTGIHFALSGSGQGSISGSIQGTLGTTNCQRSTQGFTSCSVTYTAPQTVAMTGATYITATAGMARTSAVVLVNGAGIFSNPATHQAQLPWSVELGSSGGNNNDYDAHGNRVSDCCGGTLGALIEDGNNRQYLLSNNHVLARSDQAEVGDTIVQPGLIDNNCTPLGDGPGTAPVAALSAWLPLSAKTTNVDAAIAQVASRAVDPSGGILELGTRQADGTLAAAPPGISSTGGRGETAALDLLVAKSGRTTGLTCGSVSALDLDVSVDYFADCAESRPYLTRTFTHQLAVSANAFSDSGDSGALLVDAANAEPVGLLFAGGMDASGVSQAIANPATEVLSEVNALRGGTFSFVGTSDHAVSCLNYGNNTLSAAQSRSLPDAEVARGFTALAEARTLVNPSAGILGIAAGKSSDHPGEAAILVYTDETLPVNLYAKVPTTINGVRTVVTPTTVHAVAFGSAPQTAWESGGPSLTTAALNAAIAVKERVATNLMKQNSAFFAVGAGQSLDNPREAALILYVDRKQLPSEFPQSVDGLRTRYVIMDRLHVTRSYQTPTHPQLHCMAAAKTPGQ